MVRPKERSLEKPELLEVWEAATPPFDLQAIAQADFAKLFDRIAGHKGAVSKGFLEVPGCQSFSWRNV